MADSKSKDRTAKVLKLVADLESLVTGFKDLKDGTLSYDDADRALAKVLYYLKVNLGETLVDGLKAGEVTVA